METNKEESILHEPLLRRREASCGREGASARVASRWQRDGEEEGSQVGFLRRGCPDLTLAHHEVLPALCLHAARDGFPAEGSQLSRR